MEKNLISLPPALRLGPTALPQSADPINKIRCIISERGRVATAELFLGSYFFCPEHPSENSSEPCGGSALQSAELEAPDSRFME